MTTEIQHGILKAWDSGNHLATVQLLTSTFAYVATVPTARNILSADMIVGRRVAVTFFDPANPQDAVVIAVFT
jgi:hypothetical protein